MSMKSPEAHGGGLVFWYSSFYLEAFLAQLCCSLFFFEQKGNLFGPTSWRILPWDLSFSLISSLATELHAWHFKALWNPYGFFVPLPSQSQKDRLCCCWGCTVPGSEWRFQEAWQRSSAEGLLQPYNIWAHFQVPPCFGVCYAAAHLASKDRDDLLVWGAAPCPGMARD